MTKLVPYKPNPVLTVRAPHRFAHLTEAFSDAELRGIEPEVWVWKEARKRQRIFARYITELLVTISA